MRRAQFNKHPAAGEGVANFAAGRRPKCRLGRVLTDRENWADEAPPFWHSVCNWQTVLQIAEQLSKAEQLVEGIVHLADVVAPPAVWSRAAQPTMTNNQQEQ